MPEKQSQSNRVVLGCDPATIMHPVASVRPGAPRQWWAAFLLFHANVYPALLYIGRPGWAAVGLVAEIAAFVVSRHLDFDGRIAILVGTLVLLMPLFALTLVKAKRGTQYQLRRYNKWWVYVIAAILPMVNPVGLSAIMGELDYQIVIDQEMTPTLLFGDVVLSDQRAYIETSPRVGDLVVIASHLNSVNQIRRVTEVTEKGMLKVSGDNWTSFGGPLEIPFEQVLGRPERVILSAGPHGYRMDRFWHRLN